MVESAVTGSKRYEISDFLRDTIPQEQKAFMEDLDRFFCNEDGFGIAVHGLKGAGKGNLMTVLKTISNATLGWGKPFERINRKEFVSPREAGGTTMPEMSLRTVSRCLKVLKDAGLIHYFTSNDGTKVHYCICADKVIERVSPYYASLRSTCSKSSRKINLWQRLSSSPLLEGFANFISHFKLEVINGINQIKTIVYKIGDVVVAGIEQGIRAAKAKCEERAELKRQSLACQELISANGKPNPKAALALWEREIKDTEHWSGTAMPRTGKLLGMMKNWLKENASLGEEQIRKNIHEIVSKWYYVDDRNRNITAISRNGKPYEIRMDGYPSFEFFYVNRRAMMDVIERTALPGKAPDGEDLLDVKGSFFDY